VLTAAISTTVDVPTAKLCRRLALWASVEAICADGPYIFPSVEDLAVGISWHSRIGSTFLVFFAIFHSINLLEF
jgi:hypothetical protein